MMSTEMINRIICFITQTMGMMVLVLCLDRLLTGRKGISRGKRLFFWFVLASVGAGIKVFLTTGNMSYPVMAIHQIYTLIVITAILKYCYQDKFSVKIIHFVMLMLQNILGDVIGQIFLGLETWELTEMSFTDRMMAENSIAANMCSVIFNLGYTAVALAVKKEEKNIAGTDVADADAAVIDYFFRYCDYAENAFDGKDRNVLCFILPSLYGFSERYIECLSKPVRKMGC